MSGNKKLDRLPQGMTVQVEDQVQVKPLTGDLGG
jgi:hypothetical protein